ncbi:MAG: hypothetical protein ACLQVL_01965 [Terriglobia bacterium]
MTESRGGSHTGNSNWASASGGELNRLWGTGAEVEVGKENSMPYSLERFRGIVPAALRMFDRDNNLDEEASARHWDWLITKQKAKWIGHRGNERRIHCLER